MDNYSVVVWAFGFSFDKLLYIKAYVIIEFLFRCLFREIDHSQRMTCMESKDIYMSNEIVYVEFNAIVSGTRPTILEPALKIIFFKENVKNRIFSMKNEVLMTGHGKVGHSPFVSIYTDMLKYKTSHNNALF